MTHDFACRYEKIRAFAEKFLADGGLSPVILKKYIIVPGLCDVHVHFREPGFSYKETIASGSAAAAHGGYTAVCTMPNLDPVPDSAEHLQVQLDAIKRGAAIKVLPYGAITVGEKGERLADMEAISDKVCAFSDDGRGVQNDEMMREAMTAAKRLGKIIAAHCEDNSLLLGGYIHDGEYARMHGHRGISSASEYKQIERDLRLAEETGCAYHVCHISTKESVELIRQAKARGVNVTCETAPHYLVLCDEDMQEDGRFKMNPPLRSREDKQALIEGIKDGTIDMIATDHAPHSAEEKERGLEKSLMGIVGLETAFPVLYTELVMKNIITLDRLVELMSFKPKKRFGIDTENDFAVFDISEAYKIDPENFLSMGRATPFAGREVFGRCLLTVHNEKVVYKAEDRA
ncbi:MAG: dihydroorotase [Acutalibacteraceae bacterium]|jgi:dihydroorotase|nr:dihydroorotase [Acutalibacteraceae bacterium]